MNIKLYQVTESDNNLDKDLSVYTTVTGTFKDNVDLIKPIVILDSTNNVDLTLNKLLQYNYCWIDVLNRYYFIDNIVFLLGNIYEFHLIGDPTYSFLSMIQEQEAHILKNEYTWNPNIDEHLNVESRRVIHQYTVTVSDIIDINIFKTFTSYPSPNDFNCVISCLCGGATQQTDVQPASNLPQIGPNFSTDGLSNMVQVCKYADMDAVLFNLYDANSTLITFVKKIMILPFQPQLGTSLGTTIKVASQSYTTMSNVYLAQYGSRERIKFCSFTVHREYNDFRDYEPYNNYSCYVPFVGWVTLKSYDILEKECTIYYNVDYESGSSLCYIFNETNQRVIYTATCQMGISVGLTQTNIEQNNVAGEQHAIQTYMKVLTTLTATGALSVATGNPVPIIAGLTSGLFTGLGELAHQDSYLDTANVKAGIGNAISQLPIHFIFKITKAPTTVDPRNNDYKHMYGRSLCKFDQVVNYTGFTQIFIDDFVYPTISSSDDRVPTKQELDIILKKLLDGVYLP